MAAAPASCTDLIIHPTAGGCVQEDNDLLSSSTTTRHQTFVGLSNQGATCYMNSLLQTLYMTAEFRRTLYKWTYSAERDGDEQYCIPLQLQKLFGMLQLSPARSVDTVALTKSFGWEGNERFQQQDVQELCRVLFDALEESFKGHPEVENFIDELYAGELVDYIKCMEVDYQSERKDKFLDYSVAIRPFGAEESMKSLTECIEHYLEPEILDGDNQYFAESVGRKVDAIKGLKFGSLPNVMSVQMKRFVFDFSGENIVQKKINDKVTFPLFLDMNKYVSKGTRPKISTKEIEEDAMGHEVDGFDEFLKRRIKELRSGKKNFEDEKVNNDSLPALVDCNGSVIEPLSSASEKEEKVDEYFSTDVDPLQLIADKGEWVYQLYAVLVHSGAISGGHYYVYIRDTSTNKWWNFNDSSVTEISEKTVLEAQGGMTTTSTYIPPSSTYVRYPSPVTRQYESCANAYMLMYRKVTITAMVDFPGDDLVPQYIKDEVKRVSDLAEQQRIETQNRLNKVTVGVHWKKKRYDIASTKTTLYKDFLQQLWSELPIYDDEVEMFGYVTDKKVVPLEGVRLRVFNTYHKTPGVPFSVSTSSEKSLDFLRISQHRELYIEVKGKDDEWESYDTDAINILMTEFDPTTQRFKDDHSVIRLPKRATLGDLRNRMIPLTTLDVNNIRILKISVWAQSEVKAVEFVDDSLQVVSNWQVYEGQKLYWEEKTGPLESSPAVEVFRFNANQMTINLKHDVSSTNKFTKITVDKRWNIARLRSHVKDSLELGDKFRICKFTPPQPEINGEENKSLVGLGLYAGMTLVIKEGAPLLPGQFNFKIFLYKSAYHAQIRQLHEKLPENISLAEVTEKDAKDDMQDENDGQHASGPSKKCTFGSDKIEFMPRANQFDFFTELPVHGDMMIEDIRSSLFNMLKDRNVMSENSSVKQIRLRLKAGHTCSDILRDSLTLRQSKVAMYADRGIVIEILDHEEEFESLEPGDALVLVRRWHRSSWLLSPPTEILLKGSLPVNEIATLLAAQYDMSPTDMKVLVAHPYTSIKLCDLNLNSPSLTSDWIDPISETKTLRDVKWHLTYGDCIIIQSSSEPLRALTKEEEESMKESQVKVNSSDYCSTWWDDAVPAPVASTGVGTSSSSGVAVGPQPRVVQRGIVIKTQKAREMEKQQGNNEVVEDVVNDLLCFDNSVQTSNTDPNVGGSDILFGDVD